MLVTLSGIVTLVRLVQSSNASIPDAGDAVGNRVTSAQAARILNERGLALVEQALHSHCYKTDCAASTVIAVRLVQPRERLIPDVGDAAGNRDAGQAGAVIERIIPDAGDAVGNRDAGQAGAVIERIIPDAGDAVGNRDAGQAGAVSERIVPDAGDAVGNRDAGQAGAVIERTRPRCW